MFHVWNCEAIEFESSAFVCESVFAVRGALLCGSVLSCLESAGVLLLGSLALGDDQARQGEGGHKEIESLRETVEEHFGRSAGRR